MNETTHAFAWSGLDAWRAEFAHVLLREDGMAASGVQLGIDPEPYRMEYSLEVAAGWLTERLEANAYGRGWWRALELVRESDGSWRCETGSSGDLGEPRAGGDLDAVNGALDCDLQHCPVTNTMPVRRERMLRGGDPEDFVMAWIAVPHLSVHRSEQRYEPMDERHVRYVSLDGDFRSELELDGDGLVVRYPQLAERLG